MHADMALRQFGLSLLLDGKGEDHVMEATVVHFRTIKCRTHYHGQKGHAGPVGTSRHTKGHVDSLDEVTHNMHEVTHRLTIERVVLH